MKQFYREKNELPKRGKVFSFQALPQIMDLLNDESIERDGRI